MAGSVLFPDGTQMRSETAFAPWNIAGTPARPQDGRFGEDLKAVEAVAPQTLPPYDVLVFPVVDWHDCFQRPQHLSLKFAQRGHRVFYFSTGFFAEHCECEMGANPVAPGVYWVRLPGSVSPPDLYLDIPNDVQLAAMENGIRKLRREHHIGATLSIVDYPFWQPLVRQLCNNVTIYDCMDNYSSFANAGRPARELESKMAADADLLVCSSEHLRGRMRARGYDSILIRNAVDANHFAAPPAQLALEPNGRTAGYWGVTAEWTDIELLAYAARSLPDVRFVLVGEVVRIDVSELKKLPNVFLTGEVPYSRLPAYLHAFDVCLLPYRICDYALASDPVKVWEYMAAGKPVIAVRFPEIERLDAFVTLTSTRDEFVEGIRAALDGKDRAREGVRREFARENTWSRRCVELRESAAALFPKVSVIVLAHNQRTFTEVCLASLEEFSRWPNLEIVAVDNASTDGTVEFLKSWAAERSYAKTVFSPVNSGFSAGNNLGARAATGDYLVFLNNDTFVTDGWIGDLLAHFRSDPKLGLLGPVTNSSGNESVIPIEYPDMETMAVEARRYTRIRHGRRTEPGVLHLFCAMVPRRVWEEVGELDEGFGRGLFEDDDYTNRVRAAGYQAECAEDVFIHHHQSASFGALPQEEYDELFAANRKYYESKWGPWRPPVYRKEMQDKCSLSSSR
jgi:GT2 family glycosyltransferase/glycosyltransferase involved in cell wall biosynthesis